MKKKYYKLPVTVEAEQAVEDGVIKTLEGQMSYKAGDYIITGVKGEQYPCRKDIFEETYREVEKLEPSPIDPELLKELPPDDDEDEWLEEDPFGEITLTDKDLEKIK